MQGAFLASVHGAVDMAGWQGKQHSQHQQNTLLHLWLLVFMMYKQRVKVSWLCKPYACSPCMKIAMGTVATTLLQCNLCSCDAWRYCTPQPQPQYVQRTCM